MHVCFWFLSLVGDQAGLRARRTHQRVPPPVAPLGLTWRAKKRNATFSSTTPLLESLACDRSLGFLWGILLLLPLALGASGYGLSSGKSSSNSGSAFNLTVANVTDLGTIPPNPDILGRDGGYSAVFQGYSVWLYGDTFLAIPNAADFTLISDSWSYTKDLNAQGGITGLQERLDSVGAPHNDSPRDTGRAGVQCGSQQQQVPATALRSAVGPLARIDRCGSCLGQCLNLLQSGQRLTGQFQFPSRRELCRHVAELPGSAATAHDQPTDCGGSSRSPIRSK